MLNGIALPVRADEANAHKSGSNCERTTASFGRHSGQVVTLTTLFRSGHRLNVGCGGHSLRL